MIRTRESIVMFNLVAVIACTSTAGTEPNDANLPLTFESSSVVLPAPPLRQVRELRSPWKGTVTYAAGVPDNRSPYFPHYGRPEGFIQFVQGQDISKEQRRFLETTEGGMDVTHTMSRIAPPDYYIPPNDPNAPQLVLYAVSPDDARKMAQLYLRYAQGRFKSDIAPIQDRIAKLSAQLADEQQKLPGAIQAYEAAKKAFEDLQKQVPYRENNQALDAAAELDKMLNTAQVDMAGIRARIEVIQGYQRDERRGQDIASRLELMFIEEAVALRGAEARKNMATTLRKQADSYIDLKSARDVAELERDRLTHNVSSLPSLIQEAQQKLADEIEQEPKIISNKVFIYPVTEQGQHALPLRIRP